MEEQGRRPYILIAEDEPVFGAVIRRVVTGLTPLPIELVESCKDLHSVVARRGLPQFALLDYYLGDESTGKCLQELGSRRILWSADSSTGGRKKPQRRTQLERLVQSLLSGSESRG